MSESARPAVRQRRVLREAVTVLAVLIASAGALTLVHTSRASPADAKREVIESVLEGEAPGLDASQRAELAQALLAGEAEFNVDALLILAVIERESRYDPAARGSSGGTGLMQLTLPAARSAAQQAGLQLTGDDELLEPLLNIRLGTSYLAQMEERFGDWELALTAYNKGPERLQRALAAGQTARSGYAAWVLERFEQLQTLHRRMMGGAGR